ncbi:ABC transporter substrate-binding protein [Actinacidiphila acididurans]|uniref:ABC transporter substrate-binding protein n=1 Tax=Actinacidiphila acididurans TaxID=2784346 RepID=A0ABS2TZQ0_9ACTN|nr:ABC transporter substrate-binding protein [Actinacidiphila acididurans]MBM9507770.1 ABC transporter substrate-binding protein [Actinacidiphila acididurans]
MGEILRKAKTWWGNQRRRGKVALTALLALTLAVVGTVSVRALTHEDHACSHADATVVTHEGVNGECVGFTDGSYPFNSKLAPIERAVQQENHNVVKDHPDNYVSVVLLLPISADKGSILSMTNAMEQIKGAYTAQHYANNANVEGNSPYIQLLIGSDGYQANGWRTAVSAIENATDQYIAAVTGLGLSLKPTQLAVNDLTRHDIPVFGATITSDTYDNIKNFVRVSPSNRDNMAVALSYVQKVGYTRAVLVEDDNTGDSYDATLVTGFRNFNKIPGHQIVGTEPYNTEKRDQAVDTATRTKAEAQVENRISQMTGDICLEQQPKAVVLFAGRGQDLGVLVHALSNTCLDKQIEIISGDDVTNLPNSPQLQKDLSGHVTVDYAGVAHPDEWSAADDPQHKQDIQDGRSGFATFIGQYQSLFHETSTTALSDGNTMMAYDATLTAISAVRLANQPQPGSDAVAAELGALQGAHKVHGSSGPIQFTADYSTSDTASNPVDKAVPVLRLQDDGNSSVLAVQWPAQASPVK